MKVGAIMKDNTDTRYAAQSFAGLILGICLILPQPGLGAALTLANAPLANSTTASVLPNLMFILDDSGSMGWDYLPDWANDNIPNISSSAELITLQSNADYNGVYYNPAIRYEPPVFYKPDRDVIGDGRQYKFKHAELAVGQERCLRRPILQYHESRG